MMAMVRFATTCDAPKCQRRSEEYTAWPTCRDCGSDICDRCEPKGTRREDDSDNDEGVAEMRITVLCASCLDSSGPDEFCVAPEEQDEAYARAEAEYREMHGSEL